jgi:endonuclease/exonuclease/phosphatase family metal-dependent hydrolase
MSQWTLLCFAIGIAFYFSCPSAFAGVELKVMSFNVRHGTADDGENAWAHRKDIVAGVLRTYEPHVFGAQECLDFQADYICEALPRYKWIGLGREADCTGETTALFYDVRVLRPLSSGHFWLSETPDVPGSRSWSTRCTRMATWARFYHIPSQQAFYAFNTHFDHASETARIESARLLLRRIQDIAAGAPVIVTGDFNALACKSEPWSILTGGGLSDAWLVSAATRGPAHTFGDFKGPCPDRDDRIDWVLTGGAARATYCETVAYEEDGRYPSDHYPVFAKVVVGD